MSNVKSIIRINGVDYALKDTQAITYVNDMGLPAANQYTARKNIGLENVDNTSDANKPVSTAQAAALALKSDKTDTPLKSDIAIIVNGDTASKAVPIRGYAYIQNNTHGLADGLYINESSAAFPVSGGTANSSVFYPVINYGGALNMPRTVVLIGTMGAVNVDAKVVSYPAGYTQNNCYVASAYMEYDGLQYPLPNAFATIHTGSDGIYILTTANTYAGQTVVIRLSQK